MRLIKASFEILDILQEDYSLEGIEKQIEIVGRTCYKSEDKITDDSASMFVEMLISRGHGAMLEHGTVYLYMNREIGISPQLSDEYASIYNKHLSNKYSECIRIRSEMFITTNYRVIVENGWMGDLEYLCMPSDHHKKRYTVKFICDRGVSHEFVRHRVFSFGQESTRYCNYSKDQFGKELTFIIPNWVEEDHAVLMNYVNEYFDNGFPSDCTSMWINVLRQSERAYQILLEKGWIPQQARSVLPNSLKTELCMTGFVSDWEGFFALRDAPTAHPQARELAQPLHQHFRNLQIIKQYGR